jgi:hypothetical protein
VKRTLLALFLLAFACGGDDAPVVKRFNPNKDDMCKGYIKKIKQLKITTNANDQKIEDFYLDVVYRKPYATINYRCTNSSRSNAEHVRVIWITVDNHDNMKVEDCIICNSQTDKCTRSSVYTNGEWFPLKMMYTNISMTKEIFKGNKSPEKESAWNDWGY